MTGGRTGTTQTLPHTIFIVAANTSLMMLCRTIVRSPCLHESECKTLMDSLQAQCEATFTVSKYLVKPPGGIISIDSMLEVRSVRNILHELHPSAAPADPAYVLKCTLHGGKEHNDIRFYCLQPQHITATSGQMSGSTVFPELT
ncbi:hypothetical protein GJ496_000031 [Pomphorhynchus laevis]|nr:hypothetical protein GJ496_000031 [Pomphorhynchus laevis]